MKRTFSFYIDESDKELLDKMAEKTLRGCSDMLALLIRNEANKMFNQPEKREFEPDGDYAAAMR